MTLMATNAKQYHPFGHEPDKERSESYPGLLIGDGVQCAIK
jgi:hypothetical protein